MGSAGPIGGGVRAVFTLEDAHPDQARRGLDLRFLNQLVFQIGVAFDEHLSPLGGHSQRLGLRLLPNLRIGLVFAAISIGVVPIDVGACDIFLASLLDPIRRLAEKGRRPEKNRNRT